MQDRTEFKKTETFAIEEEQRENEWQEQYGTKIGEVVSKMNTLLQIGTEQSRMELHNCFLNKTFFEHYKQTDIVSTMYVVMQIYEKELAENYTPTILDDRNTVEMLMDYLQQLKFILYRVDFSVDQVSDQELVTFIKNNKTSLVTLETMMTTVAMRPMILILKLEKIFEKNMMYRELFWSRNFLNERWSGNHRILVKLAELYDKTGHAEYALECMKQIPESLRIMYQQKPESLELQEALWKFRYKDMDAAKDISDIMATNKFPAEILESLLQSEQIENEEYYLILANQFLENKMIFYAIKILETGEKLVGKNEMIRHFLMECRRLER